MEQEIKKVINEIIEGDDKNIPKLKNLFGKFFKGKTQQDLDKFDQRFLRSFREAYDLVSEENKLSDINRAFLDYSFNEKMKKYLCLDEHPNMNQKKLRQLGELIYEWGYFSENDKKEFLSFIALILIYGKADVYLKTPRKDLSFSFDIENYGKKNLRSDLFILADSGHRWFVERVGEIVK